MIIIQNLSFWAKNHKWESWFIIAFLHYILVISAVFLANAAFFAGLSLNLYWLFAFVGISIIALSFYPIKNSTSYNYKNRKRGDLALVASGFLLTFSLFNTMIAEYEPKPTSVNPLAVQTILKSNYSTFGNDSKFTKLRKRIKRRSYQRTQQFKAFWKAQSDIVQFLLILLTFIVAVLAAILIFALACSISCSGSGAGIGAVLILGWGAIAIGAFFIIRTIIRMGNAPKKDVDKNIDTKNKKVKG